MKSLHGKVVCFADAAPILSPQTKRKFSDLIVEHGKKMDQLIDIIGSMVQEQKEIANSLRVLNKSNLKIQKYMYHQIKSSKLVSYFNF